MISIKIEGVFRPVGGMPIDVRDKTVVDILIKGETMVVVLKTVDFFKKDTNIIAIKRNELIGMHSYGENTLELYFRVFPSILLKLEASKIDTISELIKKELIGNNQADLLGLNA